MSKNDPIFLPPGQEIKTIPPDWAAAFSVLAVLVGEARAYVKSEDYINAEDVLDRAYGEIMKATKPMQWMDADDEYWVS